MSTADDTTQITAPHPVAVVIEDDPEISSLLALILTQSGFDPVVAQDGPSGLAAVREHQPWITTVDVALPGIDGLEVTRLIREFSSTYVVMISSRSGESDILGGFAVGADDYVTKPFRPRELRSRFLAGMRRPRQRFTTALAFAPEPTPPLRTGAVQFEGEWISFRGLRLNPSESVLTVDAVPVDLLPLEVDLLELLLYAGAQVRTAGDLALSLRGETYVAGSQVRDSDLQLVVGAMTVLLDKLGDFSRWIEIVAPGSYRLASGSS